MSDHNIVNVNPNIPCVPGECLVYVRGTYNIAAKYPTATAGWNGTIKKHTDQNQPGAYVPIWFSVSNNPDGHVALWAPDGSVYSASSPTSHTPFHHASIAALESYYGGRLGWRGWSEDVNGVTIAAPVVEPAPASGVATVTGNAGANVRSAPSLSAPFAGSKWLAKGLTFDYNGVVTGQNVSQGGVTTDQWVRSTKNNYIWLGNVKI